MSYYFVAKKDNNYEKRGIHGEDVFKAIEIIEQAINKVGLQNFKERIDAAVMDMAFEEMDSFDGFDESLDDGSVDDFQLDVSFDRRTNCDQAAGEEICNMININDWDTVCYTGAIAWHWRKQNWFNKNTFWFDHVEFTIKEKK